MKERREEDEEKEEGSQTKVNETVYDGELVEQVSLVKGEKSKMANKNTNERLSSYDIEMIK